MIDFADVERSVERLKRELSTGEINRHTFLARLTEMIDFAEDGYYWMFGYKSGMWYRHDGKQWILDNPYALSSSSSPKQAPTPPKNRSSNHSSPTNPSEHNPSSDRGSVDWPWFVIAVVTLAVVAGTVYISVG